VKWNLRWAAARRDIWRPSDLLKSFEEVGFSPSFSKVAALWSGKPISVRLDDLDKMCAALGCTITDLLEAEPLTAADGEREQARRAVGAGDEPGGLTRPVPRRGGPRRSPTGRSGSAGSAWAGARNRSTPTASPAPAGGSDTPARGCAGGAGTTAMSTAMGSAGCAC